MGIFIGSPSISLFQYTSTYLRIQFSEINVVHPLEDERGRLRLRILTLVQQCNYIRTTFKIFQYFYFSLNFADTNRFQNLYNNKGICSNVDRFEYFRIFSSSDFRNQRVVLTTTPCKLMIFIIPIRFRFFHIHKSILTWGTIQRLFLKKDVVVRYLKKKNRAGSRTPKHSRKKKNAHYI